VTDRVSSSRSRLNGFSVLSPFFPRSPTSRFDGCDPHLNSERSTEKRISLFVRPFLLSCPACWRKSKISVLRRALDSGLFDYMSQPSGLLFSSPSCGGQTASPGRPARPAATGSGLPSSSPNSPYSRKKDGSHEIVLVRFPLPTQAVLSSFSSLPEQSFIRAGGLKRVD